MSDTIWHDLLSRLDVQTSVYKGYWFCLFFFFFRLLKEKYEDSYEIDYKSDTVVLKFQETFRELREKESDGNNLQNERQAKKKT